ncbi:MAG: stage II sporulation protein M [Chitinophagaceae bacterium]|nr:stage II sporulation protein M [Chitinophagaceae bacterium]
MPATEHPMREGQFIKKHKERWDQYQQAPAEDPDELARRFAYLVDDLSFAKTFYPASNTTRYINTMAAKIYLDIYKNRKEKSQRLLTFWTTELPLILFRYRRTLFVSFLFFVSFFLLGVLASAMEPDFVRMVLSMDYVDMTEQNIANGDPFGVYKDGDPFLMFLFIAWNNVRVSLMMFGSGIFFGLGTLYLLFHNGVMVGAFEHMFYQHHLGAEFFLVVFIHGTLELSAVVIAACSGFVLGGSILFPGTYTRAQSLRRAAKDSVKIIVGLIPVFVIAAVFESYVTRHTEMPLWLSLFILVSSLAFILFYFVLYPVRVFQNHRKNFIENAA